MIIKSDTSPLNYLVLVGHADVLRKIFGQVIVPAAVVTELQHRGAPEAVRQWADSLPSWLLVRDPLQLDPSIELGRGESHAISLAIELHADLLLIDDRWGNRAAKARGITVAGTLNVLQAASKRGLLELPSAISLLRQTNFRISEKLLTIALAADAEHRKPKSK